MGTKWWMFVTGIFECIFGNKKVTFQLIFCWILFLRLGPVDHQHWFRKYPGVNWVTSYIVSKVFQWHSPLTEACITHFQWLWVKYILIKMCKKWYPTEGLADFQNFSKSITSTANISKSKSPHLKIPKSKSPHFFRVSHCLSPISPHYKPHEND